MKPAPVRKNWLRKDWVLALLVLAPEILIFYRKVIFSAHYVIPWDFRYYHLPLTTFIASQWRKGQFPLSSASWTPIAACRSLRTSMRRFFIRPRLSRC